MNKLDLFLRRRREIVSLYEKEFSGFYGIKSHTGSLKNSSHHLYVICIEFSYFKKTRADIMNSLMESGIGTQVHYIPVPLHPFYRNRGYDLAEFPAAQRYYETGLSIPIYYGLTDDEIKEIARKIKFVLCA